MKIEAVKLYDAESLLVAKVILFLCIGKGGLKMGDKNPKKMKKKKKVAVQLEVEPELKTEPELVKKLKSKNK